MKINIDILTRDNQVIKKEFCSEQINVGSAANNDLVFENYESVSPNHATILFKEDGFYIYSHSLYETLVNDNAVDIAQLNQNAVIILGDEGPSFIFNYSLNSNNNNRRWYDNHPLVSKAILLLSKTDKEHACSISSFLNNMFNIQNDNTGPDDSSFKRWYDSDDDIKRLIESFKAHDTEMQEKIAIDIIKFIDCMNQQKVTA